MRPDQLDCFLMGLVGGMIVMFFATCIDEKNIWEKDTINHHAAHYDTQTGAWEWNQ
jgi:hypothetical protein